MIMGRKLMICSYYAKYILLPWMLMLFLSTQSYFVRIIVRLFFWWIILFEWIAIRTLSNVNTKRSFSSPVLNFPIRVILCLRLARFVSSFQASYNLLLGVRSRSQFGLDCFPTMDQLYKLCLGGSEKKSTQNNKIYVFLIYSQIYQNNSYTYLHENHFRPNTTYVCTLVVRRNALE